MNITTNTASLPLATVVNPPTEGLRRENHQREVIQQVAATNPSLAEKGAASDKEKYRTPGQNAEQIDFSALKKHAEHEVSAISERESHPNEQQSQGNKEQGTHSGEHNSPNDSEHDHESEAEIRAQEKVINELQQRDKEVRAHELAHAAVGGSTTGAPSYSFQVGPDGKKYAVGGEVSVDLSPVAGDPSATITKMKKVHAAALAPVNPSAQDIKVAATATRKILEAQSEILAEGREDSVKRTSSNEESKNTTLRSQDNEVEQNTRASNEFDELINQTLLSQEGITPAQTSNTVYSESNNATLQEPKPAQSFDVQQRSKRIESFYSNISQGYEKPANFQFELTA